MNKDEVHPEQVFEKIYRGKVQHMKCNEVEAIIQDIVNDFSKEKIINYANGKREIIMFDDKILLITGGTGSFGNAVMKRFLDSNIKEIRIFYAMRKNKMTFEKNIIIQN